MNDPRPTSDSQAGARPLHWFAVLAVAGLLSGGCACLNSDPTKEGSTAAPVNAHATWETMPRNIHRVAVLPLMTDDGRPETLEGRDALEPVLCSELTKAARFEVVRVSPEETACLTGRRGWTGGEALPPGLCASLRDTYGCDAILFCQLTAYRCYAPLAIGWRMKLVNLQDQEILWAGDEVFDAGRGDLQKCARRYQSHQQRFPSDSTGKWAVLNSPRLFGQYTLAQLLETLPECRELD